MNDKQPIELYKDLPSKTKNDIQTVYHNTCTVINNGLIAQINFLKDNQFMVGELLNIYKLHKRLTVSSNSNIPITFLVTARAHVIGNLYLPIVSRINTNGTLQYPVSILDIARTSLNMVQFKTNMAYINHLMLNNDAYPISFFLEEVKQYRNERSKIKRKQNTQST